MAIRKSILLKNVTLLLKWISNKIKSPIFDVALYVKYIVVSVQKE